MMIPDEYKDQIAYCWPGYPGIQYTGSRSSTARNAKPKFLR